MNFQQRLQDSILTHLEKGPDTISNMANHMDYNYYSVLKAVRNLEADGKIRPTGNALRNVKYTLGENPNYLANIIPTFYSDGTAHKLTIMLTMRNQEKSTANEAIVSLPRNITRIFNIANNLRKGKSVPEATIKNIRWNMEQDLIALQRVTDIYSQVLNNYRLWDQDYLQRFHKDIDFNEDLINEAYNYYFSQDEK